MSYLLSVYLVAFYTVGLNTCWSCDRHLYVICFTVYNISQKCDPHSPSLYFWITPRKSTDCLAEADWILVAVQIVMWVQEFVKGSFTIVGKAIFANFANNSRSYRWVRDKDKDHHHCLSVVSFAPRNNGHVDCLLWLYFRYPCDSVVFACLSVHMNSHSCRRVLMNFSTGGMSYLQQNCSILVLIRFTTPDPGISFKANSCHCATQQ